MAYVADVPGTRLCAIVNEHGSRYTCAIRRYDPPRHTVGPEMTFDSIGAAQDHLEQRARAVTHNRRVVLRWRRMPLVSVA